VLDRDSKFTSKFWQALWKRMGLELKMSIAFRPQTNGQTERVNLVIQQFLRNYVAADQQD
jgi:transposase InsO family protein